MRTIIISNIRKLIFAIAGLEVVLAILILRSWIDTGNVTALELLMMDLGLILDAVLMGCNSGSGVSRIRFIAHGVLTPLLLPLSADFAEVQGLFLLVVWGLTAGLMATGLYMGCKLKLRRAELGALVRYTQDNDNPKLFLVMSFILTAGLMLPLMISGIYVVIVRRDPLILLSAAAMFGFTALAPATKNADLLFVTSMVGEVIMTFCMYLYL